MNRYKLFYAMVMICASTDCTQDGSLVITADSQSAAKMNVLIGAVGAQREVLIPIAQRIRSNFSCQMQKKTGFCVTVQTFDQMVSKKQLHKLFLDGYPLVIFLNCSEQQLGIEWRIYDTAQATMVCGKIFSYSDQTACSELLSADRLSNRLWKELTGLDGCFGSQIAYCVQEKGVVPVTSHLCTQGVFVADPKKTWACNASIKVAPRWHPTEKILFYSECTPSNVRLMMVDQNGQRRIISNRNGLNMSPSFNTDGSQVALCLTNQGRTQIYRGAVLLDGQSRKSSWQFTRLTLTQGNNLSPILRPNGDLIYCSDSIGARPQIYYYSDETGQSKKVTRGLSATCPTWHEQTGNLVYSQVIDGVVQLFEWNHTTQETVQLTYDGGDKEEASWSGCGNYICFDHNTVTGHCIAILNMVTKERFFLPLAGPSCMYPSWGPGG